MSADTDVEGSDSIIQQLHHLRRFWWVIAAAVLLAVLGAIAATMSTSTSYTGRASLIVSSNDRSPDQDAVLVQGYVAYFNDPAYQIQLLASAHIEGGVSVSAQGAAASPILLVHATTSDPKSAQSSAAAVAVAFQKAINQVRTEKNSEEIADVRERLNEIRVSGDKSQSAQSEVTELQDRIAQIQGDRVDMLQELQLASGVTQNSVSLKRNVLFALFAGALVGGIAAVAAGKLSGRVRTSLDVAERFGLNTLVVIPDGTTTEAEEQRRLRFRQLAAVVKAQLPDSAVVAVTDAGNGLGTARVASELAEQWALMGYTTLLVRITGDSGEPSTRHESRTDASTRPDPGGVFGGLLEPLAPWLTAGPVSGMWVLKPGRHLGADPEIPADSVFRLLAGIPSTKELVIIEAPAVADSVDAQMMCAAAGANILVVDRASTSGARVVEAVAALEKVGGDLLGAVLLLGSQTGGSAKGLRGVDTSAAVTRTRSREEQAGGVPQRPTVLVRAAASRQVTRVRSQWNRHINTGQR